MYHFFNNFAEATLFCTNFNSSNEESRARIVAVPMTGPDFRTIVFIPKVLVRDNAR